MRRVLAVLALLAAPALAGQTPRPAGEIEFASLTGLEGKMRLSGLRGKVVVIEFLLSTCPGCKHSAGILARLQREYGPRGLQVVGLAIDPGAAQRVPLFVAETGANFPIGLYNDEAARRYLQVPIMVRMMMPQVVIIDRKGMIREQHAGDDPWMAPAIEETNLRKVLEKLLAEGSARRPARKAALKK